MEDPEKGLDYDNLRLVRAFELGLDPTSSEAGFVLVHIAMVKESGALVKGTVEMLKGATARDRERFDEGLRTLVEGLRKVNAVMNSKHPFPFIAENFRKLIIDSQLCGTVANHRATLLSVAASSASLRSP